MVGTVIGSPRRTGLLFTAVAAGGAAVVAIGLILVVLATTLDGQRNSNARVRRSELVLRTASDAERAVVDAETGLRGYVITTDPAFLAPYRTGVPAATARLDRLEALVDDPRQRDRARRIHGQVDDYVADYARPLLGRVARSPARARSVVATAQGKRRVDAIRAGFAAFNAAEVQRLTSRLQAADHSADRAIAVGVGGLLLLLALVAAFGWYVARRVARPVQAMAHAADRLAAGDLSVRVPEGGAGELDRLSRAFNVMAEELGEAQAGLRRRAVELETIGRRAEALLDVVFAQAPVGLAVFDVDLCFVRVNAAFAAMDGVPEEDHLGRGLDDVVPAMAGEILADLRDGAARRAPIIEVEVEGATPADPSDVRVWRASYFPIETEGGELIGSGAIFVDITDQRRAARERRRLLEAERSAAQRTLRLQEMTARLSRAVAPHDVAQVVVEQVMAALGAAAGVVVLADPASAELELAAVAGYGPREALDWRELSVASRAPLSDAVRTGRIVGLPDPAALHARYPGQPEVLERSGHRAWVAAPIAVGGDVRGGALFAFGAARALEDEEARMLELLLAQAGQALDRAALYERQRHIASTLQRSLLPARMPEIPGIELAAVYRPAGDGNEVGGDFYDVVPTGGGRWVVAIGDVQGKGPEAAALTGLVRHTLRAETMRASDPSELLRLLNRVVYLDDTDRFCTVALAVVEPGPDGARVEIACGGHLPPIVTRRGDAPAEVTCRGRLLGVEPDVSIAAQHIDLGVGDGLVLYTDGLLDAAAPDAILTARNLVELIAETGAGPPREVADRLHAAAVAGTRAPRDDIAIIALRVSDRRAAAGPGAGAPTRAGSAAPS